MVQQVGILSQRVKDLLCIPLEANQPIYLGDSNIAHMIQRHPEDYSQYGQFIPQILANPDYVGQNPGDGSIEYVKDFCVDNQFVKVAVRLSQSGNLFVRSLYVLNTNRVHNFIRRGTLKRV